MERERKTENVNPPFNRPGPQLPHIHENGFDARCGLCMLLRELAKYRTPQRAPNRKDAEIGDRHEIASWGKFSGLASILRSATNEGGQ
jgi:hypothetical protein